MAENLFETDAEIEEAANDYVEFGPEAEKAAKTAIIEFANKLPRNINVRAAFISEVAMAVLTASFESAMKTHEQGLLDIITLKYLLDGYENRLPEVVDRLRRQIVLAPEREDE